MIDKVQKIREEVERIKTNANKRGAISKHSTMVVCNEILSLIDSLQEEPVNIWHDSNEEQPEGYRTVVVWNHSTMDGEVLTRCAEVYKGRIWAYIEDLLNLSNVQRTTKNWEEPVSEDLEEAAKEHAVERFRTTRDEFLAEKCKWSFKAGAKWQKQEDDREKKMVRELLADFDKHCDEFMNQDSNTGKEALMKEAVNAKVHNNGIVVDSCDIASFLDKCNDGEEIKIILIKED